MSRHEPRASTLPRDRETSVTDEERFRLLTGFKDVFVVIACALVLVAAAWLVAAASKPFSAASFAWAGLAVSAAAWLLAFLCGVAVFAFLLLSAFWGQARSALLPWVPGGVREWLPSARMA